MKKLVVGLVACMLSVPAFAFTPDFKAIEDDLIPNRYPEGSIKTRQAADQAIADVKQARAKLNQLSDYSTRRCYSNFFVNSCIDDVRKAKMRQEARLKKVESQAKGFVHEDKHRIEVGKQAQRDRKAAEKRSKQANPPRVVQPIPKESPHQPTSQKAIERSAQRQQRHAEALANAPAEQAALENRNAEKQAKAAERARRAQERAAKQTQRHEKAVADQEKDRKEREERMKERQRKNAEKAKNSPVPQNLVKQVPQSAQARSEHKEPVRAINPK
jgi:hypothetical protein